VTYPGEVAAAVCTVAIAGSTGSIGTQTVDVVRAEPERFEVVALAARCASQASTDELVAQAAALRPKLVVVTDPERADAVAPRLPAGTDLATGTAALTDLGRVADVCVNAVVGFAGLELTLATLEAGRRLALANKESLIAGGPVVRRVLAQDGAGEIVPVDSEHCALHQCLQAVAGPAAERRAQVERLVLTASGGPFRGRTREELAQVTVGDALAHPTWSMGPKVTIDSSTLMNKGLEVIEAHELFGVDYDCIEVVVHPQSVVHSMVELRDGATLAQLSQPDMRGPIGYALGFPRRLGTPFGGLDWTAPLQLDFASPDHDTFPCLGLAYQAGQAGETAPAALNAANEVAVAAFLDGRIGWLAIPDVLKAILDRHDGAVADGVDAVVRADQRARDVARRVIDQVTSFGPAQTEIVR
jgi:1-deoxy-D-xylulose-5-phosphate reductoisomerase